MDQFYEQNKSTNVPDENIDDGLPMNITRLWAIQSNTANGTWGHYTFATFSRSLRIDSTGVSFV